MKSISILKRVKPGTGVVLLAGFGGMLALMAFAELDSIRELRKIEAGNYVIVQQYLSHHRDLDRIRSLLFRAAAAVRDYFLESDPAIARTHLENLAGLKRGMVSAIKDYSGTAGAQERQAFGELQAEIDEFWKILDPMPAFAPQERRDQGYAFLKTEVFPRTETAFRTVERISEVNQDTLNKGDRRLFILFDGFRQRLTAMLAATLCLGVILAGFVITHLLRTERDAMARYEETMRARSELQRLSARLLEAQENERRTISRELHDQVGQSLSALLLDLGNLAAVTPAENGEAHKLLCTVKRLAEESVSVVRNMSLLLRPSMLDDLGLVPAIRWQAREVSRRTGIRIDVVADEVADELPEEHKTCIYRVVQEALHNAARHAEARAVRVGIRQEAHRLLLSVQDEGKGFDPKETRGLGLIGMEERVKHLDGVFRVQSKPGQGTLVAIDLPLPAYVSPTSGEGSYEQNPHFAGR